MPRFAANLSMLYTEHPFLERFAAAASDGFDAVEHLFPYEFPAAELRAAAPTPSGLEQALFNAPPATAPAASAGWPPAGARGRIRATSRSALVLRRARSDSTHPARWPGLAPDGADRAALRRHLRRQPGLGGGRSEHCRRLP